VLVGDQRPVPADWRPGAVSDPQRRGQRPRHRRRARPRQAIEMIRDTLAWNITRSGPEKGREGLATEEAGRPLPALTTEPAGFPPACVAEVSQQVNPVRLPLGEGLGKISA
jgi:hypothetical protein